MTKKWTEREALSGGTVEPDSLTDEFRAQQSSITTLDREQLPDAFVDTTRLKRKQGQAPFFATSGSRCAGRLADEKWCLSLFSPPLARNSVTGNGTRNPGAP